MFSHSQPQPHPADFSPKKKTEKRSGKLKIKQNFFIFSKSTSFCGSASDRLYTTAKSLNFNHFQIMIHSSRLFEHLSFLCTWATFYRGERCETFSKSFMQTTFIVIPGFIRKFHYIENDAKRRRPHKSWS